MDRSTLNSPRPMLLKDIAYDKLKRMIIEGDLAPGRFVSERELAELFEMSKSPVRSAIERLNMEGYLIVSPQRGVVIAELSVNEVVDHFELRMALECFIVQRLAGNLASKVDGELTRNLEEQVQAGKKDDLAYYRQLDGEFHLLLADALGNQEVSRVMAHQHEKLSRVITRVVGQRRTRMKSSYEEHLGIVEAIRHGDGPLAARLMEEHLNWGQSFLLTM